jgi:hypothetical protein
LLCEYYNPAPTTVSYRGHNERLFKRDFAGEIMDRHPEMQLVDYGFAYHRDPNFPQDDITWFLMEKVGHFDLGFTLPSPLEYQRSLSTREVQFLKVGPRGSMGQGVKWSARLSAMP